MTVTITEKINLNGKDQGSKNTLSITGISEISSRIVTATTDKLELLSFGTGIGKGSFVKANVRYMRFTNLDDTNHLNLFFTNESDDEFAVKLDKGQSFIYNGDLVGGTVDTMDANNAAAASSGQLADLVKVSVQTDSDSCDLEYIVASA
tara:strand:- start:410 stop:856 length:447 start_codon:yes stop_codon:yes gene_type:complete